MCQSKEINELATALNKVQHEDLFALTDKENPFFKSKYADLSSVWSVARKPLTENGLSIVQTMRVGERDNPIIVTTLLHESGQWISGELEMPAPKKDPQQFGSAVTYGRRYSLAAMIGICPADDDAQSATNGMKKEKKKAAPKNTAPTNADGAKLASQAQYKKLYAMMKTDNFADDDIELFKSFLKEHHKTENLTSNQMSKTFDSWDKAKAAFLEWEKTINTMPGDLTPQEDDIPF